MKNYVMLFEEYQSVSFKTGPDKDFPAKPIYHNDQGLYAVFNKDTSVYRLEGRTHGGISHAILHLKELDESAFNEYIQLAKEAMVTRAKDYIDDPDNNYIAVYRSSEAVAVGRSVATMLQGELGNAIVVNTLDYVNDKLKVRGWKELGPDIKRTAPDQYDIKDVNERDYVLGMFEIENILPIIKMIYQKYYSIISDKYMDNAIDLSAGSRNWPRQYQIDPSKLNGPDDVPFMKNQIMEQIFKNGETVSFLAKSRGDERPVRYYISFKDQQRPFTIIQIPSTGQILTAYKGTFDELVRTISLSHVKPAGDNMAGNSDMMAFLRKNNIVRDIKDVPKKTDAARLATSADDIRKLRARRTRIGDNPIRSLEDERKKNEESQE